MFLLIKSQEVCARGHYGVTGLSRRSGECAAGSAGLMAMSSGLLAVLLQPRLDRCIHKALDLLVSKVGPVLDELLHQLEEPGVELDVYRHAIL